MNQQTFLQRLESFGYTTLPRPHAESPGYGGLLVVLRQEPTAHQPETMQLRLHDWDGQMPMMKLHADLNQPLSHVVCPGRIVIRSRQEREVTFYTFGGSLESETLAGETVFSLRSTAPVLELLPDQETVSDLLAAETEDLLARAEPQQQLSSRQMLDQLVKAGPEAVYLAVLQSLLPKGEGTAVTHHHPDFSNMLTRERNWYQKRERWPLIPHDLTALVQAMSEK